MTKSIASVMLMVLGLLPTMASIAYAQDNVRPPKRTQNLELRIVPANGDVAIDGKLDDWDRSGEIFICNDLSRPGRQSARVAAMYDQANLYLALEVRDATPLINFADPDKAPEDAWKGDCLQLRLNLPGGKRPRIVFVDSWYYRTTARPAIWLHPHSPRGVSIDVLARGGEAAFVEQDDAGGYVQELKIPWKLLDMAEAVKPGLSLGMGLEIVGGRQGEPREPFRLVDLVAQRGESLFAFFQHPQRWGTATLMSEGNLHKAEYLTMPIDIAEHPFLICKREDFPELRQRAQREPWMSMKADALARVAAGPPDDLEDPILLQKYLGACALAYIVDEGNEAAHALRVHEAITHELAAIKFDPSLAWAGVVRQMGAAFVAILALDIVHDDLSEARINDCESVIHRQINKVPRTGSWLAARLGTHGTWDIYVGDRIRPDDAFLENYLRQMTDDGVSTVSPGYAFARLGSGDSRPQKTAYADVLEFTGIDQRYYHNPRLAKFYRWLYGSSMTPSKDLYMFGDVAPMWRASHSALQWRVGRFDRQAAAYAAWLMQGMTPPGHVLSYVLMNQPLPEPQVPASQLFFKGEAVFREPEDSPLSLGAALYNITANDEWHTHEEVNAISLAAYGARLVVNGGWLGDEMRPPWRNNTLAIEGRRHAKRTGAGLTEGLLAGELDYACGDSGRALGDDAFLRSLVLVHGRTDAGGYFVVLDEVDADPGEKIHTYLQTASENAAQETSPLESYRVQVNHHARVKDVGMTVFYATAPVSVSQEMIESGTLTRVPAAGHHNRLEAIYDTDPQGAGRILTVYFPHDKTHPPAAIERITQDRCTGALITHANSLADMIISSDGRSPIQRDDVRFQGRLLIARQGATGGDDFYFVRLGVEFHRGGIGFSSDQPISLYMRGGSGTVTATEDVKLTLHHPGIRAVECDAKPVTGATRGQDAITFDLPAGQHRIELQR